MPGLEALPDSEARASNGGFGWIAAITVASAAWSVYTYFNPRSSGSTGGSCPAPSYSGGSW